MLFYSRKFFFGKLKKNKFMKKQLILLCSALILGIFTTQKANAQTATQNLTLTVSGSSLLAVDGGTIGLSLGGATQAGDPVGAGIDGTSRLRITSLTDEGFNRTIDAQITSLTNAITNEAVTNMTATNTTLSVLLGDPNSNFNYPENGGTSTLQFLDTPSALPIRQGITTCWSGTSLVSKDGYPINYTYERNGSNPKSVKLTITYTISSGNGLVVTPP